MRRNSIFGFIFYIAILCLPQYAAAQTSVSAGDVWREEGIASWYGPDFDGRPTASGEIFNATLFTAAHPTLPFGTFLKVTNKQNNRWVTVKVNDRGPFIASRIIDVSKAAAEHLDMITAGTAPVIIETLSSSYLPPPKTQDAAPVSAAAAPPVISQAPAAVPEPPPAPVYEQAPVHSLPRIYIQQPQPIYPPAPATMPESIMPLEYSYVPSAPMMYSPFYTEPPQAVQSPYPAITAFPPQLPPLFESLPPQMEPQLAMPFLETAPPSNSGIKLIPAINPLPHKNYKLQIGSYKVPRNAVEAFGKLKEAGLNPMYEQNGEFYRVVLVGIRGTEVQYVADKLEKAGFREAIIREEN